MISTRFLTLVMGVGLALTLGFGLPAAAGAQSSEGRILYTKEGGLWLVRISEPQPVQLAPRPDGGFVTTARWSRDGTQVAYGRYMTFGGAPRSDITVAAADGSSASIAVPAPAAGVFFSSPVWGPGASLYVLHTGQENRTVIRQIERVDLTSGRRDIVLREAGEFDVSPDGRFLALMRLGGANPGLVLIDLASGQETMLVPSRGYEVMSVPRFDPTSQIVLFAAASFGVSELLPVGEVKAAHGSPQDLYTVSVQGGPATRLAALSLDEPIGSYSPDGARLAILSAEYLALMPSSGGEVQILVSPGTYGSVDWAP